MQSDYISLSKFYDCDLRSIHQKLSLLGKNSLIFNAHIKISSCLPKAKVGSKLDKRDVLALLSTNFMCV